MASVDIVNCKSCQVQIIGTAPTAVIDKTDGLNLFLSPECMNIEVYTAKSSELNLFFSKPGSKDEFVKKAVPIVVEFKG
jgi:adenylyl cyclase-associated protein